MTLATDLEAIARAEAARRMARGCYWVGTPGGKPVNMPGHQGGHGRPWNARIVEAILAGNTTERTIAEYIGVGTVHQSLRRALADGCVSVTVVPVSEANPKVVRHIYAVTDAGLAALEANSKPADDAAATPGRETAKAPVAPRHEARAGVIQSPPMWDDKGRRVTVSLADGVRG